jgi:exonuclease III
MRILTWNCNGALRKKFNQLEEFDADIYVVQECENPLETACLEYQAFAENHLWIGDNKNKGVGVFAKPIIQLDKLVWSNKFRDHTVKYFLPCRINDSFDLIAVWTHRNNSPNFGYMGQFWKYLKINLEKFDNILIAGDFNSNSIWDQWDRWWNHSDVVNILKNKRIESLYHYYLKEEQGKESQPTFYLQRKRDKPYHIDYMFGAYWFQEKLNHIKIEQIDKWLAISDHLPLVADFNK